ncbi:hypothetical protein C8R46DRAFT_948444, partial [Mycena filopes]
MHHALEIPEILDLVVAQLALDRHCDLAALALTCTDTHDVALDVLWREQDTVLNLLRCMPADLWETVFVGGIATLRARRELVPSDWDRWMRYAYRVRSLICTDPVDASDPVLDEAYRTITQNPPSGGALLPRLEHLSWCHRQLRYSPLIDIFLTPNVQTINLDGQVDHGHLFTTLVERCPSLLSVTVRGVTGSSSDLERRRLSTFVCALTSVELLDVRTIDLPMLMHLDGLATLRTLRATLPASLSFADLPERSMFSQLHSTAITLAGRTIPVLTSFVRTWNNPQLHSFDLLVRDCRELEHIADLYDALASHASPSHLVSLTVSLIQWRPPVVRAHDGTFLRPLLRFAALRV